MRFITFRDLRENMAAIRKSLPAEHEMVVTVNGRPFAILADANEDTFEGKLKALRATRARVLFDRIGAHAKARGGRRWTMKQIDAEIAKARAERRAEEEKAKTWKRTTAKNPK